MMTGKIDTSAAAVEILARDVCDRQRMRVFGGAITKSSAEIMRALAAERDALRAEVERLRENESDIRADERAKVIAEAVSLCEDGTDQGYICGGDEQARVLLKHLHTPASRAIAGVLPTWTIEEGKG